MRCSSAGISVAGSGGGGGTGGALAQPARSKATITPVVIPGERFARARGKGTQAVKLPR